MRKLPVAAALVLSAAAGLATMGAAMPPPMVVAGKSRAIPVGGCHSNVRRHHVPELGASAWHYHRGANCRTVIVDGDVQEQPRRRADCHRDARTHRVGGVRLTHRHVGDDCRIREVRGSSSPAPN